MKQRRWWGTITVQGDRNMTAPIALFIYNRLWHTQQVIKSLLLNSQAQESDIFIFSDGKKATDTTDAVDHVRAYIATISGFKSVTIIERDHNMGLARSIIAGVSHVLSRSDRVIVLEDDITVSPYFLEFMNAGLEKYALDERVGSINAYVYPVKKQLPENFFLQYADCWGWGTWRRSWNLFNPDGAQLLLVLRDKNYTYRFDFSDTFPFAQMLEQQVLGKIDSWAIRWQASLFLAGKLSLYPSQSLINNIGFDGSGIHGGYDTSCVTPFSVRRIALVEGLIVQESLVARKSFERFFVVTRRGSFAERISKIPIKIIKKIKERFL